LRAAKTGAPLAEKRLRELGGEKIAPLSICPSPKRLLNTNNPYTASSTISQGWPHGAKERSCQAPRLSERLWGFIGWLVAEADLGMTRRGEWQIIRGYVLLPFAPAGGDRPDAHDHC
jgi:hypothetical protein